MDIEDRDDDRVASTATDNKVVRPVDERSGTRHAAEPRFGVQRLPVSDATGMPFRFLHDYWKSKCGDADMPLRSSIDPIELKPVLSAIAVIEVLRDPLRFRYRLAGTQICDIHGFELTGRYILDLEPPSFADALHADLVEIVETRQGHFIRWDFVNREGNRRNYSVLRLPLSLTGRAVDQIIVCADYSVDRQALRDIFDAAHGRHRTPASR